MLITIISLGLLVVGVLLSIIGWCYYDWRLSLCLTSAITVAVGGVATLTCSLLILTVQIPAQVDYENKLYEREMLEYRLSQKEANEIGNELLYNDIVTFNNELRSVKQYSDNVWVNWFVNQKIATIDYIDVEK